MTDLILPGVSATVAVSLGTGQINTAGKQRHVDQKWWQSCTDNQWQRNWILHRMLILLLLLTCGSCSHCCHYLRYMWSSNFRQWVPDSLLENSDSHLENTKPRTSSLVEAHTYIFSFTFTEHINHESKVSCAGWCDHLCTRLMAMRLNFHAPLPLRPENPHQSAPESRHARDKLSLCNAEINDGNGWVAALRIGMENWHQSRTDNDGEEDLLEKWQRHDQCAQGWRSSKKSAGTPEAIPCNKRKETKL